MPFLNWKNVQFEFVIVQTGNVLKILYIDHIVYKILYK